MDGLFELGQVVITQGVKSLLDDKHINHADLQELLYRHLHGDWGDVCLDDQQANEGALKNGARILSSYICNETKLWIITEADRASTCILQPSEY